MGKRTALTAGYILARGAPVNFCWGWVHETPSRCANRGGPKASVAFPPSPQLSFGETRARHGQGYMIGVLHFPYVVQTKRKPTIPPHCCCPPLTWPRFVGVVWASRATRGYLIASNSASNSSPSTRPTGSRGPIQQLRHEFVNQEKNYQYLQVQSVHDDVFLTNLCDFCKVPDIGALAVRFLTNCTAPSNTVDTEIICPGPSLSRLWGISSWTLRVWSWCCAKCE